MDSGPEARPDAPDSNGDGNAGQSTRPAWNRRANGVPETGPVMGGAVSWPDLSESTRPGPRAPSDSARPVSDGSVSTSQAPLISQPPPRQANAHSHANSSANNASRPRSRNRGGGASSSGSGPTQPPLPDAAHRPAPHTSVSGARPAGGGSQRNAPRRGSTYGPRPRGDGPHHNNYGGRRHQDRRDVNIPPLPYVPHMGFMAPPPPPPPFVGPPPMRVFTGHMGFEMASPFMYVPSLPHEQFRAVPIVPPPPPPMFFPPANEISANESTANENKDNEDTLTDKIVKQIDYYFSDDNLAKDNFLRSNMDHHGWVPITLIASFQRVKSLTRDIQVILDALSKNSKLVEVEGDKIRRLTMWEKWLYSSNRNPQQ